MNNDHNECEPSKALLKIMDIIEDFKIHESVDVVSAVDLLASELRMRRAKEIYEIKLKSSIIGYAKEFFQDDNEE
jgi:hypothetical protein